MKKDIFLLDADGTILDFDGSSKIAIREGLKEFGIEWKDEYAAIYKTLNDGLWERLEAGELTREKLHEIRFRLYLEKLGADGSKGKEFNDRYMEHLATRPQYINGAEAFLKKLAKNGAVYIVTNGTAYIQKTRFDILDIFRYVRGVFVSGAIGADKPSPVFTKYVVEHIDGFEKSRAVWIGDSLTADIKAANEACIDSIWYNPNGNPLKKDVKPTFEVKDFVEIEKILEI